MSKSPGSVFECILLGDTRGGGKSALRRDPPYHRRRERETATLSMRELLRFLFNPDQHCISNSETYPLASACTPCIGLLNSGKEIGISSWPIVRRRNLALLKNLHGTTQNGIESFWALLKRGYNGVYHKIEIKHLHRYINELATRHNRRNYGTEFIYQSVCPCLCWQETSLQGTNTVSMRHQAKQIIEPVDTTPDQAVKSVFSSIRELKAPDIELPDGLTFNTRMKMDGVEFLSKLPANSFAVAFFDPQHRGLLDKLRYGNEGQERGKARCNLKQMSKEVIAEFISGINEALIPSGHLFLWMDKFHLCTGFTDWMKGTQLDVVDMLTWNKLRIGMGYRTRRMSEHLVILQKQPRRAKGIWKAHNIPDVVSERVKRGHPHIKPVILQGDLLAAVTNEGDIVIDPAAGSFSVFEACKLHGRYFLGCDLNG